MGQFCLNQENDCQNDIRLALNGSQQEGGCGFEGLTFKSPAHIATAAFSSVSGNSEECYNTSTIDLSVVDLEINTTKMMYAQIHLLN